MRLHRLIHESPDCNSWLIEWPPGSGLDWHDHGDSKCRIVMLEGVLTQSIYPTWCPDQIDTSEFYRDGLHWHVPARTKHKVENLDTVSALSLHVYSPPLTVEYPEALEIG